MKKHYAIGKKKLQNEKGTVDYYSTFLYLRIYNNNDD